MTFAGARVIALDVGERRIGIAVSDELGLTAQGLETLERRNVATDMARLGALAEQYQIANWVVGLPLRLSGRESGQAEKVRAFGQRLEQASRRPVEFLDERLTTVEAERVLRQAEQSRQKSRRAVDRMAAVILLQSYLDRRHGAGGPAER
ncbi:MAG TPA: Holliday junction resolvase RuvX [Terriglobales bacterium]|nr:Holliday junction resolvase RuvX [Terriglobales bacterium]